MSDLGHARFAVAAISGGAPYAVAVAACLQPRVTKLALISPVGPIAEGAPRVGLSPLHRFSFLMLPSFPWAIARIFSSFRLCLARAPRFAARLATLRSRRDRALIMRPEIGDPLIASFREGLRPGMAGPITDLAVFSRPWNIPLSTIKTPTQLWIGSGDRAVPLPAVLALAAQIEGCVLTQMPGEGHFWLAANYARVLAWIASSGDDGRRIDP
jgi:pimeloyl-ACP methyl ester carboxylesterase